MIWLLLVYFFYIAFALCVSVYRLWLGGRLNSFNKLIFAPILAVFFAIDLLLNYTIFMVFGLPPTRCVTISDRMAYYHTFGSGWRRAFAVILCERLLNPLDPTGQHC